MLSNVQEYEGAKKWEYITQYYDGTGKAETAGSIIYMRK